jgi:guanine nucleotide-binding protein G(i) subunit alpha
MGNCLGGDSGSDGTKLSEKRDISNDWNGEENGSEVKIILLGSGESGKSTMYRQIQKILAQMKESEIKTFVPNIYENIWRMTKDCCISCQKRYPNKPFDNEASKGAAESLMNFDRDFGEFKDGYGYTKEIYNAIITLWNDPKIQEVFPKYKGADFHANDGWEYLFKMENLLRYKPQPEFVPSFEDMIQCRKKTIGINKLKFRVGQKEFIITDVGGQRNERKKWANAFENVSVLIFVASLGDFDQMCYEDDVTNRMTEAIELFEKTINNTWFINQQIILLLNKKDILVEKLKKKDLSETFEEYKGGKDYENSVQYIAQKFRECDKGGGDRITVKFIQATDTKTVSQIFEEIKSTLAEKFK